MAPSCLSKLIKGLDYLKASNTLKICVKRNCMIWFQSAWRAYVVRKKVKATQRKAAVKRIEEAWIDYAEKRRKKSIIIIQTNWRGFVARKR